MAPLARAEGTDRSFGTFCDNKLSMKPIANLQFAMIAAQQGPNIPG
jgi:hypothetical protein